MKAAEPEPPSPTTNNSSNSTMKSSSSNNKSKSNNASPPTVPTKSDITTNPAVTLAPQKLNRKQRRKLQQMQNAETQQQQQSKNNAQEATSSTEKPPSTNNQSTTSNASGVSSGLSTGPDNTSLGLKSTVHGDGLLPTPPASYRLMHSEQQGPTTEAANPSKAVTAPVGMGRISSPTEKAPSGNAPGAINQKVIRKPVPIGQEQKQNESAKLPIGSSRPSNQFSNNSQQPQKHSTGDLVGKLPNNTTKNSTSDLNPPTNPVLLAQMHLQKLGLEEPRTSGFLPSSSTPQTVTNSYIQQYLQQMNSSKSSSDIINTSSVAAVGSSMSTPLLATSLSSLLPQPPVPASSLSDGPQKSKLLQWTQPSSASNSEPTTPPSVDDDKNNAARSIDPVSAKWGVLAAPRLSPTPAEFKPGVPWRPRGVSLSDKDDEDDALIVKQAPIEIPQSSFATKLMQKQQELELAAAAASSSKASQLTWVLLKGFPPMVIVFWISLNIS